jgi:hypothetical protein
MLMISVTPFNAGWAVRAQGMDNDMVFASGAKAEAAARRLAGNIAATGQAAEIAIWLRGGVLAGRFICPPTSELAADEARP